MDPVTDVAVQQPDQPVGGEGAPADLAAVLHHLDACWADARVLLLTSTTTGTPALQALDVSSLGSVESLRYEYAPPAVTGLPPRRSEQQVLDELGKGGRRFDLALVDPFHDLAASRRAIEAVLGVVADRSIVLVHDCWPPASLRDDAFPGPVAWCGRTYRAFLDVALAGDRDWCVVDADFGIGVLGPAGSRGRVRDWGDAEEAARWRSAEDEADRLQVEAADAETLWHLLPPEPALAVVDAYVELDASDEARAVAAAGRRAGMERRRADAAVAALAEATAGLSTALAERDEARRTAAEERQRADTMAAEAQRWRSRADSLRQSPSMRVGRTVTAPVRAWRERRAGRSPEPGQ